MKKILIIGLLLLIALSVFGQNKFKYPVNANGGLRVGGDDHDLIDSVKLVTGDVVIYIGGVAYAASGATIVDVRGEIEDSLNVLRPLVVMVADTGTMLTPYINRADTSGMLVNYILTSEANAAYANKALSNLASVAINTHLLPATDGAVNLGSATKKFGDIHQDSAKSIIWNNGDVILTGTANALTLGGGNLALGSNNLTLTGSISTASSITASGLVSTGSIRIGTDDTGSNVDSIKISGTSIGAWDGATQLSWDFPASDEGELGTYSKLLGDTIGIFVFGAGSGAAADSTLFEMNDKNFGSFYNYTDTLYVVNFNVLYLTSGDSLRFNCYYGNRMTGTPTDSLFNAIQAVGTDQNILTPNDRKIPPNTDVWIKMSGTQLTGLRPKQFEIQLNGYTIRDH